MHFRARYQSSNSPPIPATNADGFGVNPASHGTDHNNEIRGVGGWTNPSEKYQSNFGWFPPIISGWQILKIFDKCHHLTRSHQVITEKKSFPKLWPPASFWGHPPASKKHAQASEHSANIAPFLQRLDVFLEGKGSIVRGKYGTWTWLWVGTLPPIPSNLPETNIALKIGHRKKETIVFQPSNFQVLLLSHVSFREGNG